MASWWMGDGDTEFGACSVSISLSHTMPGSSQQPVTPGCLSYALSLDVAETGELTAKTVPWDLQVWPSESPPRKSSPGPYFVFQLLDAVSQLFHPGLRTL